VVWFVNVYIFVWTPYNCEREGSKKTFGQRLLNFWMENLWWCWQPQTDGSSVLLWRTVYGSSCACVIFRSHPRNAWHSGGASCTPQPLVRPLHSSSIFNQSSGNIVQLNSILKWNFRWKPLLHVPSERETHWWVGSLVVPLRSSSVLSFCFTSFKLWN